MSKTFNKDSILQIEDYFVVVDKEAKINQDDYAFTLDYNKEWPPKIVRLIHESFGYETLQGEPLMHDNTHFGKIIASIGKRIGDVPLIELPDELEQLALKEYPEIKVSTTFENGTREGYRVEYDDNEEFREGFIKGYKANKGKYELISVTLPTNEKGELVVIDGVIKPLKLGYERNLE